MSFHPIISANSVYFKTHLQEKIVLVGEIERFELKKKDSSQAVIIAEKIVFPDGKEEKSEGRVLLNIKGACTVFFRPGTQVSASVTLEAFSSFKTPGVFDVATYMKQQGIYARASVPCEEIAITATQKIFWIQDRIIQIREIISFHIDQMVPDKDANSVLKALLIGDRHEISLEVQESFSRTGTAHLLAISGLHVGLVMALFFFLFRSILYFSNRLTQTGNARKVAALLTILPVLAYGLIAGMSPSTQRAVIMCLPF